MHIPHTIQVWGIVSFVLVRVFPQPSSKQSEVNSTLSVYIKMPVWSWQAENQRYEKDFFDSYDGSNAICSKL